MISLLPIAALGTAAVVLLIGALAMRQKAPAKARVPVPVACVVVGLLLAGGVAYVANTLKEPPREQGEEPQPLPGVFNMTQNMGGMGAPPDPKRPLVVFVQKLALLSRDSSFDLTASQRAELRALLAELAEPDQLQPADATAKEQAIRALLTDEQVKTANQAELPRPTSSDISPASFDFLANPFKQGAPKESLDALMKFLEGPDE